MPNARKPDAVEQPRDQSQEATRDQAKEATRDHLQAAARADSASLQIYARIAGAGYLAIIVAGIFAEFFVRQSLIVPGDPAATMANISEAESLFRLGIAGDLIMLTADVVVAVALYFVFRGVSRSLALLAAFFRLAQAGVLGLNLLNVYVPLMLLGGAAYRAAFPQGQLDALSALFLEAHSYGYVLGLVFFGFHCLVVGYLVLKSGLVPRILGALLLLAGMGYLADSFGRTLMIDYATYANTFALLVFVPALVGELAFCLWLLIKGVRA